MKIETRNTLYEAWLKCDTQDKSTEYTIQYMQDVGNVDHDCIINFLMQQGGEKRKKWIKDNITKDK